MGRIEIDRELEEAKTQFIQGSSDRPDEIKAQQVKEIKRLLRGRDLKEDEAAAELIRQP